MTRIGITGHVRFGERTAELVEKALREALKKWAGKEMTGVSCLAPGSDQIFAKVILELGGRIEVVLPARDYREVGIPARNLREFDRLVAAADSLRVADPGKSGPDTYLAASKEVIAVSDLLLAVWDDTPDRSPGGTGDAVAHAHSEGVRVEVVWPAGAVHD